MMNFDLILAATFFAATTGPLQRHRPSVGPPEGFNYFDKILSATEVAAIFTPALGQRPLAVQADVHGFTIAMTLS